MKIYPTSLNDSFLIKGCPFSDDRGFFLNIFRCQNTGFSELWGDRQVAQVNISQTYAKGTIRGLHYQVAPKAEAKLITCLTGKVWDVMVDLRQGSKTFGRWQQFMLSPEEANSVFIPEGFAHGFQSLEDHSKLLYIHSQIWSPECESGIRFDDPTLDIHWPLTSTNLSVRDTSLPYLYPQ